MKTKYYCKELNCNNKICRQTVLKGQGRCLSCAQKERCKNPKDTPNYKDGRKSKIYYCKEPGCNNEISYENHRSGQGRCASCENKRRHKLGIINLKGKKRPELSKRMTGKNHPMFNKHHTEKTRKKISQTMLKNETTKGKNNPMHGKLTHGKWEIYKGIGMRSSYEIVYAKYLDRNNIKWEYEPKVFDLGNTTYTPDFYLPEIDLYIEIKGWWRDKGRKKFDSFKKLYPNIEIKVLMEKELQQLGVL